MGSPSRSAARAGGHPALERWDVDTPRPRLELAQEREAVLPAIEPLRALGDPGRSRLHRDERLRPGRGRGLGRALATRTAMRVSVPPHAVSRAVRAARGALWG